MHFNSYTEKAAKRCSVVLWCAAMAACSHDDRSLQACAHADRQVASSGDSAYVLHAEETVCDDFNHSDKILLFLTKGNDTRRINVLEYVPSSMRDEPRATWSDPGKLRIDLKAVEAIRQTYDVSELQVNVAIASRPASSSWLSWLFPAR